MARVILSGGLDFIGTALPALWLSQGNEPDKFETDGHMLVIQHTDSDVATNAPHAEDGARG
jgi:hypothetical protein